MKKINNIATFGELKEEMPNIEYIRIYFDHFEDSENSISEMTYNDLNIEDLFYYTDRCLTSFGQMRLYFKLRHIPYIENKTDVNENIISQIENDEVYRKKLESILLTLSSKVDLSIPSLFDMTPILNKWQWNSKHLPHKKLSRINNL